MSNTETLQQLINKKLDNELPFAIPAPMISLFGTSALGGACFAIKGSAYHLTIGMNTPTPINKIINKHGDMVCAKYPGEFFDVNIDGAFSILPLEHRKYRLGTIIDFIDSLDIDVCLGRSYANDSKFSIYLPDDEEKAKGFKTIISEGWKPDVVRMMADSASDINTIAIKVAKGVLFIREHQNDTMDIVVADDKTAHTIHADLPRMSNLNTIMLIMLVLSELSPIQENSNQ